MSCIYCRREDGPFTCVEHIIPESLGNDEDVLPIGTVCDQCNHYFGSKVEELALSSMPFAVARVTGAVQNKKGKVPTIRLTSGVTLEPTGQFDVVRIANGADQVRIDPFTGRPFLKREPNVDRDRALARMLVKIGLGFVAKTPKEYDVFDERFDSARRFAREAPRGLIWEFAQGEVVDRSKLIAEATRDKLGAPLTTHRVYQWQLLTDKRGHVLMMFEFRGHVFILHLTRNDLGDLIERHRSRLDFPLIARSGGTPS